MLEELTISDKRELLNFLIPHKITKGWFTTLYFLLNTVNDYIRRYLHTIKAKKAYKTGETLRSLSSWTSETSTAYIF